jgi:hypothetical protein
MTSCSNVLLEMVGEKIRINQTAMVQTAHSNLHLRALHITLKSCIDGTGERGRSQSEVDTEVFANVCQDH